MYASSASWSRPSALQRPRADVERARILRRARQRRVGVGESVRCLLGLEAQLGAHQERLEAPGRERHRLLDGLELALDGHRVLVVQGTRASISAATIVFADAPSLAAIPSSAVATGEVVPRPGVRQRERADRVAVERLADRPQQRQDALAEAREGEPVGLERVLALHRAEQPRRRELDVQVVVAVDQRRLRHQRVDVGRQQAQQAPQVAGREGADAAQVVADGGRELLPARQVVARQRLLRREQQEVGLLVAVGEGVDVARTRCAARRGSSTGPRAASRRAGPTAAGARPAAATRARPRRTRA